MTLPKRTVEEWVTVVRVSAPVKTVFLEGSSDARLIAVASGFPEHVDFRSADEIELNNISNVPFSGGNRARVVALGEATDSIKSDGRLKCIVDADFSILYVDLFKPDIIMVTDYANLPVGAFSKDWLRAFLLKAFAVTLSDVDWNETVSALNFAFLTRYVAAQLSPPKRVASIDEHLNKAAGGISFDRRAYLNRTFGNALAATTAMNDIQDLGALIAVDMRHLINSNDLFDYTYGFLRKSRAIGGGVSRDAVRSAILGSLPMDLGGQSQIIQLREWFEDS